MGKCLDWLGPDGCRAVAESVLVGARAHRNLIDAHCPFHTETTPGGAFFYDPARDYGKCYSCGEWGDLIAIWCAQNGYDADDAEGFREFRDRFAPQAGDTPPAHTTAPRPARATWRAAQVQAPEEAWQTRASAWVDKCAERLQREAWLLELLRGWGITPATARACRIGYNDRDKYPPRAGWGLPAETDAKTGRTKTKFWLPGPALILPAFRAGQLIKVKARRLYPERGPKWAVTRKYWEVAGSSRNAFHIYGNPKARVVIVVETERDAALLWQEGRVWDVMAMGTGGATKTPDAYAEQVLRNADVVLVAFDSDEAGAKAWFSFWRPEFPNAVRVMTPSRCGKDIGDSVLPVGALDDAGGWELDRFFTRVLAAFFVPVGAWLEACIPGHVLRAVLRDQRRARLLREKREQEGIRQEAEDTRPATVREALALLASCRRAGLVCGDDKQGVTGCDHCPKVAGCAVFRRLSELFWNDDDVWDYVDERGRISA